MVINDILINPELIQSIFEGVLLTGFVVDRIWPIRAMFQAGKITLVYPDVSL